MQPKKPAVPAISDEEMPINTRRKLITGVGAGGLVAAGLMGSRDAGATTTFTSDSSNEFLWQTASAAPLLKLDSSGISRPTGASGAWELFAVNVKDFGAKGDGVHDDTSQIQNALNSSYELIYFPAGRYLVTGAAGSPGNALFSRTGKTLILKGDGPQATQIIWNPAPNTFTPSDNFLYWSTTNSSDTVYDRLEVRDLTIRAAQDLGTAIYATKAANPPRVRQQVLIDNVEITGTGPGPGTGPTPYDPFYAFTRGIYLEGLENSRIRSVCMECDWATGSVGIQVTALSGYKVTAMQIQQVTIYNFETGVLFGGLEEGLMVSDSVISGCKYCVRAQMSQEGLPGIHVSGCHLNSYYTAVDVGNASQAIITDNLIYLMGGGETYYFGVDTGSGTTAFEKDVLVRGNIIMELSGRSGLSGTFGVFVRGSTANESVLISDNQMVGFAYGVLLQSGTSGGFVSHSNRYRGCATNISDSGSNTIQV